MRLLIEEDLQFDFTKALSTKRFDDPAHHGLSHCMKAVDFVVELSDRILFIEAKDPQNPRARLQATAEFVEELQSDSLIKKKLVPKCRDSYLYELSMGRVKKPVYYVVLVALDTLTAADLSHQTDLLNKHIPVEGPPKNPWLHRFIQGCMVMNLKVFRQHLPGFPVLRLSQQPKPIGQC